MAALSTAMISLGVVLTVPLARANDTFVDVPTTYFAHDHINELVKLGFVDGPKSEKGNRYFPEDNVTRDQAAKICYQMAKRVGILSDLDATNPPVIFTDVARGTGASWASDYIYTVTKAGLMSGYKTSSGTPTGQFGPGNPVTRAEFTKIAVNCAGIPNKISPAAPFTDILSHWAKDFITTSYNKSVLDGLTATTFGPDQKLTRGQMAKITLNALSPKDRVAGNGNSNAPVTNGNSNAANVNTNKNGNSNSSSNIPKAGTLDIQLSPNTPNAQIVPANTTSATYVVYRVTAGASNDIQLSGLTLMRVGQGDADDLDKVWVEYNGVRVSNRQSPTTDDRINLIFSPALVVKAGSSIDLVVMAQMDALDAFGNPISGKYNAISLQSANDVASTAAQVTGTFPLTGATMQTSGYLVTRLDYDPQGNDTNYDIGDTDVELGRFDLENLSDNKTVNFKYVAFKNEGSADLEVALANVGLYEAGKKLPVTVQIAGDYLIFDNINSLIDDGKTRTYTIRADIVDGDNNDTIQFRVRYLEDLRAFETSTGFGATGNWSDGATDFLPTYTIEGGTITVSRDPSTPPTQSVALDSDEVTLLVAKLNVGQPFSADGLNLHVCSNQNTPAGVANQLSDIKLYIGDSLIDSISGTATDFVASGTTNPCQGTVANDYILTFDSSYTVTQDTKIKIVADIDNAATTGNRFSAVVRAQDAGDHDFLSGQSAEYTNDENVLPTDTVGQATGNVVTIQNSLVTVSRNDGFTSPEDVVPGVQMETFAKWNIRANDAADLTIREAVIKTFDAAGTDLDTSFIPACYLYIGGSQVGDAEVPNGAAGNATMTFNGLNVPLARNTDKQMELRCDISTGAPGGNVVGFQLNNLDIEDDNSNGATFNPTLPLANTAYFQVQNTGTLTVVRDDSTPDSGFIVAESSGTGVFVLKMTAKNDAVQVREFSLGTVDSSFNTVNDTDGRVSLYELSYPGGSTTAAAVNGLVKFNLGSTSTLKINKDQSVKVTVKAITNDITQAIDTGKVLTLATIPEIVGQGTGFDPTDPGLFDPAATDGVYAISDSLGQELGAGELAVSGFSDDFVITDTKGTFANVTPGSTTLVQGSEQTLYTFVVASDAHNDFDLNRVTFDMSVVAAGVSNITVRDPNNDQLNSVVAMCDDNSDANPTDGELCQITIDLDDSNPSSGETVDRGSSRTFVVKGDVNFASGIYGFGTHSVSTRVAEEAGCNFEAESLAARQADGCFIIWSDNSEPGGTIAAFDHMSGQFFDELPLSFVNLSVSN